MRFQMFKCEMRQPSRTTTCHVIAASEEHAAILIDQHIAALDLREVLYSLERVDHRLSEEEGGLELDNILENAPAGLVSYTDIGWVEPAGHKGSRAKWWLIGIGAFLALFYALCGFYTVQPIGALPEGATAIG